MTLWEVDCSEMQMRTLQAVVYAPDGSVRESHHIPNSFFAHQVPGSLGAGLISYVCYRVGWP
jgi:hypothetical protein